MTIAGRRVDGEEEKSHGPLSPRLRSDARFYPLEARRAVPCVGQ